VIGGSSNSIVITTDPSSSKTPLRELFSTLFILLEVLYLLVENLKKFFTLSQSSSALSHVIGKVGKSGSAESIPI